MQKLAVGLALSTLVFAGCTIYFWHELEAERARRPDPSAAGVDTPAPPPVARTAPMSAVAVAATSSPAVAESTAPTPQSQRTQAIIDARKQTAANAPAFLARLADPLSRAELVDEQKAMKRSFAPGMQRYLGLSDEAFDQLQEALVESELVRLEATFRCSLDEKCRFPNHDHASYEAQRRDTLSQFGSDIAEKYDFYERSDNQRRLVEQFRGRLDDATRLSDAQSEKLVRALMEESQRIDGDLQRAPQGNISSISGIGFFEPAAEASQPSGPDRSEEVAGYNRRLREAAANVLTAAQAAAFDRMQKETLDQVRVWNRRQNHDVLLAN